MSRDTPSSSNASPRVTTGTIRERALPDQPTDFRRLLARCRIPPMPAKRTRSPKPRTRRTPEDARTHILDAADAVFRDHLPDGVGLREIADAAGVSHGLITHYFSTYDGLVAAVIARRLEAARASAFAHLAQMT